MRSSTTLLLALLLLFGAGLGLFVMWRTPSGGALPQTDMPSMLGGVPQGHVYAGLAEEPGRVNPFTTGDHVARGLVLAYTHDTLLDRDPVDGSLRSALAERYEVAPDGMSVIYTLRVGVEFADGTPLTMEDVLFGWQLKSAGHLQMGSYGSAFGAVAEATALDARRLRVNLRVRHYAGVQTVGEGWIVAQKQFFVDRIAALRESGEAMPAVDSARFAQLLRMIELECGPGTGPYALFHEPGGRSTWRPGQDLLLVRNERCWRRKVQPGTWNVSGIRTLFRDHAGGTSALLRGELDWYSSPTLDDLLDAHPELLESYERLVYDHWQLGFYRFYWNCDHAAFADVRVRRALGMLIKRDEIMKVFEGAARLATAHAKPGSPGYGDLQPLPFDPSAARRLLREAGYDPATGKALKLRLLALAGNEPLRRILELFADACKQAGIELELRPRELPAFVDEKRQREWDGVLMLQFLDAAADPYRFLHKNGADNDGHWIDDEVSSWLEAAQIEPDVERRGELWRRVHARVHELQPAALIVHPLVSVLFSRHVQGVRPGPLGMRPERAWVAPEFQRQ